MANRGYKPPNYTQVPHLLIREELPKIGSLAELKVILAVCDATIGWHKDSYPLSIADLSHRTGLARSTVQEGVAAALGAERIHREKAGQGYVYSLNISSPESGPVARGIPESGIAEPPTVPVSGTEALPESGTPSTKESIERNGDERKEREAAPPQLQEALLADERHPHLDAVKARLYEVSRIHGVTPPSDQAVLGALSVARPGVDVVAVAEDFLYWAEHGTGKQRGVKLPAQTYRNFLKRVTVETQRASPGTGSKLDQRQRMMDALDAVARGDAA